LGPDLTVFPQKKRDLEAYLESRGQFSEVGVHLAWE